MKIHKNIGDTDFLIRIVLLALFIYLSYAVSRWFYLLVAFEIFVLWTRWCFAYDFLGIDTLGRKRK
jgi:hypothetical protein